jgi:ketosteroid isomerase-like protein
MADNRVIVEQFLQAMMTGDIEAQERVLADDIVEEYPQSGERIRGKENRRAIFNNYPGGTPRDKSTGDTSPKAPILIGAGDQFVASGEITYPNGETWQGISFIEVRDGKISKITAFFAAPFEAPAWRAPYVEVERADAGAKSR